MATGVVLCQGDKTTCGGRIMAGSALGVAFGHRAAREGDPVTCGKDGKIYRIIGGISILTSGPDNKRVAGSLDSYSSCPCKARILPSNAFPRYEHETSLAVSGSSLYTSRSTVEPPQAESNHSVISESKNNKREGTDAGFAIISYGGTTENWQRLLFSGQSLTGAEALFTRLNGAGKEYKAGSVLLLVDPDNQDAEQIAHMQNAKARIDEALEPLTHEATIANFSEIADKGIGLAAEPVGKYFENIGKILNEIQITYKNTYLTRGALIGEQFYVQRAQLFKELESVLKVGFLNKAMKFGEYTKIKHALGLSTSSITHKWNETGIGDIEGYATHIERAAKYVKAMKYIGYVGIGFSAAHSMNEINEACSVGRENECTKKKYTEIGSFSGGIGGGILTSSLAVPLCIAIGIGSAGTGGLVCTIIAGGILGYAGGEAGSWGGEKAGNSLYNVIEEAK